MLWFNISVMCVVELWQIERYANYSISHDLLWSSHSLSLELCMYVVVICHPTDCRRRRFVSKDDHHRENFLTSYYYYDDEYRWCEEFQMLFISLLRSSHDRGWNWILIFLALLFKGKIYISKRCLMVIWGPSWIF